MWWKRGGGGGDGGHRFPDFMEGRATAVAELGLEQTATGNFRLPDPPGIGILISRIPAVPGTYFPSCDMLCHQEQVLWRLLCITSHLGRHLE